jgi:hypothetical protein
MGLVMDVAFTEGSRRGSSKTGSGSDIIKDGPKKRNTKT